MAYNKTTHTYIPPCSQTIPNLKGMAESVAKLQQQLSTPELSDTALITAGVNFFHSIAEDIRNMLISTEVIPFCDIRIPIGDKAHPERKDCFCLRVEKDSSTKTLRVNESLELGDGLHSFPVKTHPFPKGIEIDFADVIDIKSFKLNPDPFHQELLDFFERTLCKKEEIREDIIDIAIYEIYTALINEVKNLQRHAGQRLVALTAEIGTMKEELEGQSRALTLAADAIREEIEEPEEER